MVHQPSKVITLYGSPENEFAVAAIKPTDPSAYLPLGVFQGVMRGAERQPTQSGLSCVRYRIVTSEAYAP